MIKIKNKISKGAYEIIKVDENFKEFGDIYEDDIPTFRIYEPEKKIIDTENIQKVETEKLTERYELRLTETEKKIITALRNRGVNVSEQIRSFIISLDEQIARDLNQAKYEQMQEASTKIIKEINRIEEYKKEYEYLRGETQEEAQFLADFRANIKKTINFLESKKKKIDKNLEKYEAVFSSSEHPKG